MTPPPSRPATSVRSGPERPGGFELVARAFRRVTSPPMGARLRGAALSLAALALAALPMLSPSPLAAQEEAQQAAEERLGREVSHQEIMRRLRQSGLSRQEARRRLRQRGYDPSLLDPYFQRLEAGEEAPTGEVSGDFAQALADLGILRPGTALHTVPLDTLLRAAERDTLRERLARDTARDTARAGPVVFGKNIFARATDQFEPIRTGPVPPDYRLGPGDRINLVLTGDVEQAYTLEVTREGFIVIPDVGQVSVNGLTMEQLEQVLFRRLGQVYSGVRRGRNQSTFFNVSLGQLRTNTVYVIGEVERPGAYQVSSVATVFNALYATGGPAGQGSFRNIRVRRAGQVVQRVDLYEYLLHGDASQDVRVEQGDIVYVPLARRQITVQGEVARPAIFELRNDEDLKDLLDFAGGAEPEAFMERVQIDRILPPEERSPDRNRKLIDVNLERALADDSSPVALKDGDVLRVFAVSDRRRDRVTLRGAVVRPGTYELTPGMTVWSLIRKANGLVPEAYTPRAQVIRLRPEDRKPQLYTVSLQRDSVGRPVEDMPLSEFDEVVVYSRDRLRDRETVNISGWVKNPGTYPLAEGMTLKDLVLAAGGLRDGAYVLEAEVSRLTPQQQWSPQLSEIIKVPIDSTYYFGELGTEPRPRAVGPETGARDRGGRYDTARPPPAGGDTASAGVTDTAAASAGTAERIARARGDAGTAAATDTLRVPAGEEVATFTLDNYDRVFIRRAPGFQIERDVQVTGEVILPGTYSLARKDERLTDLIRRTGGLTPEAYPGGFQLWREGTRVGVELVEARRNPESDQNVLVEPGDSLHVPRYTPTVEVRGAVGFETKVLYREGAGLGYYIENAGGYAENADEDRTRVRYANGEAATKGGGFLFFGGGVPDPDPGSVITVPAEPEREDGGLRVSEFVGLTTSVLSAVATVIIAVQR